MLIIGQQYYNKTEKELNSLVKTKFKISIDLYKVINLFKKIKNKFLKNKLMEERNGFLTPEQEQKLDELVVLKGLVEALDGTVIKLLDNQGLEKLKVKIPAEYLPIVYEIIDEVFKALVTVAEAEKV